MSERQCKTISFNLDDPFEKKILKHAAKNGAFSKYIKRLIQRDLEGWGGSAMIMAPIIENDPQNEDLEAMASFF